MQHLIPESCQEKDKKDLLEFGIPQATIESLEGARHWLRCVPGRGFRCSQLRSGGHSHHEFHATVLLHADSMQRMQKT